MTESDVGNRCPDRPADIRATLAAATCELAHEGARSDAEVLLAHALGHTRAWLYAHADERLDDAAFDAFTRLLQARIAGQPVAYLTGRRGFHSLELAVGPGVLIPRPETELLVDLALQRMAPDVDLRIADLGTGTGAIALAIARERPCARVLATDVSETALAIARENALQLEIGNVQFAHGDWCAALGTARFDIIVSNPPYIAEDDAHLVRGDLRFEPRAALASGPDGLDAMRSIVDRVPLHLTDGGWLLMEHGAEQGSAVRALLKRRGFSDPCTERDLADHDRVSFAQWHG